MKQYEKPLPLNAYRPLVRQEKQPGSAEKKNQASLM
jgi:hypothetical protein